jgi:predicted nucleotidyltransferase
LIHKAKLKVTNEGKIQDFLGVNIDKVDDKTYHLSQPQLIDQILEDLNLVGDSVKTKDTPAPSSRTLTAHPDGDDEDEGFTVWADSDFSGNWDPEHSMHDPNTARSRSGYFITYLGAPLMWKSSLQTKIALSTCEAEYICLSQALRKVIPIMDLVQELKDKGVPVGGTNQQSSIMACKSEDNIADILTKPVDLVTLLRLRYRAMGW